MPAVEVGCLPRVLDSGAAVTALVVSPAMIEDARRRVGERTTLSVADVARPLSFVDDQSFDRVAASLVLHHVPDWSGVPRVFARVLKREGRVVFSTHHPPGSFTRETTTSPSGRRPTPKSKGSGEFDVTFWRRPLTAMCEAIAAAGFVIERLVEPEPSPELANHDPAPNEVLRSGKFRRVTARA